jgi:hypothetical protein
MFFCACSAACASDAAWQPVKERQDFKIDDKEAILESAFDELRDVYGSDLDIDELKKGKSYVHSIHSEKFNKDIIVVMIEDREQQEADCYYEVVLAMPDMDSVSVGGIWLDAPIADYLDGIPAEVYGEGGILSDEPVGAE